MADQTMSLKWYIKKHDHEKWSQLHRSWDKEKVRNDKQQTGNGKRLTHQKHAHDLPGWVSLCTILGVSRISKLANEIIIIAKAKYPKKSEIHTNICIQWNKLCKEKYTYVDKFIGTV